MSLQTDEHFYGAWHGPRRPRIVHTEHIEKGRSAFVDEGGTIEEPKGHSLTGDALERGMASYYDIRDNMPPAWQEDLGPQFTRKALEEGRDIPAMIAWTKDGSIAGAASYSIGEDHAGRRSLYISYVGTTGIAEGVGSALAARLIRKAAAARVYIRMDAIVGAQPFWAKMGMKALRDIMPKDYGYNQALADQMGLEGEAADRTLANWTLYTNNIWGMTASDVRAYSDRLWP